MCEIWTKNAYIGGKMKKKVQKTTKNAYIGGKCVKKVQKTITFPTKNAYIGEIGTTLHTFPISPSSAR